MQSKRRICALVVGTLSLVAVAACSSSGPRARTNPTARQAAAYVDPMLANQRPQPIVRSIDASAAHVWLALKNVYEEMSIPVTVEVPTANQIGNPNFTKSRQLGGQPMTRWLNCGTGMTGPKAASYRITASLLTQVIPETRERMRVEVTFLAIGQDVAAGDADKISCGSTGAFEQLFLNKVALAAAAAR